MTLKLDRLPDREAVKISFTAEANLMAALKDYAEICRRTYSEKLTVNVKARIVVDDRKKTLNQ